MTADKKQKIKLIPTKSLFVITLVVMMLTILGGWLLGVGKQHTLIENSLLSTIILSSAFFLFISIGLYNGIKLKDNIGKITVSLCYGIYKN